MFGLSEALSILLPALPSAGLFYIFDKVELVFGLPVYRARWFPLTFFAVLWEHNYPMGLGWVSCDLVTLRLTELSLYYIAFYVWLRQPVCAGMPCGTLRCTGMPVNLMYYVCLALTMNILFYSNDSLFDVFFLLPLVLLSRREAWRTWWSWAPRAYSPASAAEEAERQ